MQNLEGLTASIFISLMAPCLTSYRPLRRKYCASDGLRQAQAFCKYETVTWRPIADLLREGESMSLNSQRGETDLFQAPGPISVITVLSPGRVMLQASVTVKLQGHWAFWAVTLSWHSPVSISSNGSQIFRTQRLKLHSLPLLHYCMDVACLALSYFEVLLSV